MIMKGGENKARKKKGKAKLLIKERKSNRKKENPSSDLQDNSTDEK